VATQHSKLNGRAHPSWKTNRDPLMKDNLGCYCPKTFEMTKGKERKVVLPGIKASGLSCQSSATEL